jgi:hypothetical protein
MYRPIIGINFYSRNGCFIACSQERNFDYVKVLEKPLQGYLSLRKLYYNIRSSFLLLRHLRINI